jgi:hypothetical protein
VESPNLCGNFSYVPAFRVTQALRRKAQRCLETERDSQNYEDPSVSYSAINILKFISSFLDTATGRYVGKWENE